MRSTFRMVLLAGGLALLLGFLLQNSSPGMPGNGREADRKAIGAVLEAQQSAWNRGDVDAFLVGYWHSKELTFSGSGGVARGWDGVLARYKKNYPDRAAMGQLAFSDLEFRFLGPDAALVLGRWHLKREKDDVGGVFSLVWQRFPDGWKIVHDHTSAVAPASFVPGMDSRFFDEGLSNDDCGSGAAKIENAGLKAGPYKISRISS
jgi:ketosteroid isomerase-like protein